MFLKRESTFSSTTFVPKRIPQDCEGNGNLKMGFEHFKIVNFSSGLLHTMSICNERRNYMK